MVVMEAITAVLARCGRRKGSLHRSLIVSTFCIEQRPGRPSRARNRSMSRTTSRSRRAC